MYQPQRNITFPDASPPCKLDLPEHFAVEPRRLYCRLYRIKKNKLILMSYADVVDHSIPGLSAIYLQRDANGFNLVSL